ncbi:MAG: hypothetical protein QM755_13820 [Luteolibacter sp.]
MGCRGFGAAHQSALITGTGTLTVSVGAASAYDTWTTNRGLTGPAAAFNADPDNDGVMNGIEFVLGGEPNPANAGSNSVALLPTITDTGSSFVITYHRRDEAAYLNPVIQFSTSMDTGSWTTAVDPTNATISVVDGTPSDTVTVTIPKNGNIHMFARLKVTQ